MTDAPWPPTTTRNLCDKLYDKRKQGAQEVEQLVKDLNQANEKEKILNILDYVIVNFSTSPNGNHRKGALIALAAVAIGLGPVRIFSLFFSSKKNLKKIGKLNRTSINY